MASLLDGLAGAAFGPHAVRTEMFRSSSHGRALDVVLGAPRSAAPAIAVIGEAGAGKTTVLRTALGELSARRCRLLHVKGALASPAELQKIIGEEPRPAVVERPPDPQAQAEPEPTVLAIDDAHLLPVRTFRYLALISCVLAARGASLRTVLFGRMELRATLHCPDLAGLGWDGAQQVELLPLSPEEAAEYVAHKLRLAGIPVARVISEAALAGLIGQTAGNPRLIDEAAGRVFSAARQRGCRRVTRGLVRRVLSAPPDAPTSVGQSLQRGRGGGWRPAGLAAAGLACVGGAVLTLQPVDWSRWPVRRAGPAASATAAPPSSTAPGPEEAARVIPAVAAAPSPAAEPPPIAAEPSPEKRADMVVAELISLGARQLREGHVSVPAGDNATETFERIIAALPDASVETLIAAEAFHSRLTAAGFAAAGGGNQDAPFPPVQDSAAGQQAANQDAPPPAASAGSTLPAAASPAGDATTAEARSLAADVNPSASPAPPDGVGASSTPADMAVAELISQGARQLREGHVSTPAGDNATETFESIMAALPDASVETLIAAEAFHSRLTAAGFAATGGSNQDAPPSAASAGSTLPAAAAASAGDAVTAEARSLAADVNPSASPAPPNVAGAAAALAPPWAEATVEAAVPPATSPAPSPATPDGVGASSTPPAVAPQAGQATAETAVAPGTPDRAGAASMLPAAASPPGDARAAENRSPTADASPSASPAAPGRAGVPSAEQEQTESVASTAAPALPELTGGEARASPPPATAQPVASGDAHITGGGNGPASPTGGNPAPAPDTSSATADAAPASALPAAAPLPDQPPKTGPDTVAAAPGPQAVPQPPLAVALAAVPAPEAPAAGATAANGPKVAPAPPGPQDATPTPAPPPVAVAAMPGPVPAVAPAAARASMPPALIEALLKRGDAMLAIGDISGARLLFRSAAAAGSERAVRAMGQTYDPLFLQEIGARGIQPDPVAAASWYRKAIAGGDQQAADRLKRLNPG